MSMKAPRKPKFSVTLSEVASHLFLYFAHNTTSSTCSYFIQLFCLFLFLHSQFLFELLRYFFGHRVSEIRLAMVPPCLPDCIFFLIKQSLPFFSCFFQTSLTLFFFPRQHALHFKLGLVTLNNLILDCLHLLG